MGEVDLPTRVARGVRVARVAQGKSWLLMCRSLEGPRITNNVGKRGQLPKLGWGQVDRGRAWHG